MQYPYLLIVTFP
uniref:Uncharacterized protein n=1 Tax=Anguilla anguilla TaxID=7936 RepID=A0A0E9Q4K5_ANGAN